MQFYIRKNSTVERTLLTVNSCLLTIVLNNNKCRKTLKSRYCYSRPMLGDVLLQLNAVN